MPRNRIALVTGSSRGIGRDIAIALATDGAFAVGVHSFRSSELANETARRVAESGAVPIQLRSDFSQLPEQATQDLADDFLRKVEQLTGDRAFDVLVNNAGVAIPERLGSISPEAVTELFSVNLLAPLFLTQALTPFLRENGRVVNVTSALTRTADKRYPVYTASKAALDAITITLASELGPRSITVNSVLPGYTATDKISSRLADVARKADAERRSALGRIGTSRQVAAVVRFLASPAADWITGQRIDASGGLDL